jgi:hypothetical protein
MSRVDLVTDQMLRVMPNPRPKDGVRLARARLEAAGIAAITLELPDTTPVPCQEVQMANALEQAREGATLERVDADPTNWDPATAGDWRFNAVDDAPGAADYWLDRWGAILQVPRVPTEADDVYSKRILREVIAPGLTNIGMALLIDAALGITGTLVVEAADYFESIRYDDGHRLDDGVRFSPIGAFGTDSLWNCFVVLLPEPIPGGHTDQEILDLIDRRRAAGTRLLAMLVVA